EAWLDGLSAMVGSLASRWSLSVGAPFQPGGQTAWVAPVRDSAGRTMVLKVGWPHREARDEARGLRAWAGHGAVRLHRVKTFAHSAGLLLERCEPGTPLASRPEEGQDVVIAALLRRLWRARLPGDHGFRPLQMMCDDWAEEFETKAAASGRVVDRGLARDGLTLFRSLPATAACEVLLCTDLHAENVLAAQREPWLVIDPKPYVGDPTYDALQHLLNCPHRLHANPRELAWRLADLLDLDRDRLLLWLFARCVQESLDYPALAEIASRIAPT
ncbi:MAG: kinase, partial [Actinobacteria bacterium]|nr:kinase [Actinomycetota bacterium]